MLVRNFSYCFKHEAYHLTRKNKKNLFSFSMHVKMRMHCIHCNKPSIRSSEKVGYNSTDTCMLLFCLLERIIVSEITLIFRISFTFYIFFFTNFRSISENLWHKSEAFFEDSSHFVSHTNITEILYWNYFWFMPKLGLAENHNGINVHSDFRDNCIIFQHIF